MNSTYRELEDASTREVKEMHGRLFRKIKELQRDRHLVLEELEARLDADDGDADVLR